MDNYPPGAKNDPSAPWNQAVPDMKTCPLCMGSGRLGTSADELGIYEQECANCDGEGSVPEEPHEPDPDSMKGGPDYE